MSSDSPANPYQTPTATLQDTAAERWVYLGFGSRFLGWVADNLLLIGVTYAAQLAGLASFVRDTGGEGVDVPLWLYVPYFLVFWIWKAATPGKLLVGGRIVDARSGRKALWWQYLIRFGASIISSIPLLLGYWWALFNQRNRTWHDYAAGTVVVVWDRAEAAPLCEREPAGDQHRCRACGHRAWFPAGTAPQACASCGRSDTYLQVE